jgi:peptide chain release factor 2
VAPTCGAIFDNAHDPGELAQLERKVAAPHFWDNQAEAQKTLQRQRRIAQDLELRDSLAKKIDDIGVLLEWAQGGEAVAADLTRSLDALEAEVDSAETKKMLGGEHDAANAIVSIHPGAGGTESQDWAEMLLRMYLKWAERRGFKREVLDYQPGEEAGLKSVTFTLTGEYAFGLMSAEAGVHRLVRISPFDQAARRHTSFASVYVWPEFDDEIAIDIPDKDLRIDTYRSSGAGGQHVNVTDSAVRLTHLPTGIVVSCQNERSQHKNRDVAMKVLKARLYDLERQKQQDRLSQIGGAKKDIAFGSQIRSYVLQPYQMIKDHRTKYQEGQVDKVLNGDIEPFITTYLMQKASGTLGQPSADDEE